MVQLKAERDSMVEKCAHDLKVKEGGLEQVECFAERFSFMEGENQKLKKEIENITKIATEERFSFGKLCWGCLV